MLCRFCGFGPFLSCPTEDSVDVSVEVVVPKLCPRVCGGSSGETCYLDAACATPQDPFRGLGCNARGLGTQCRFCGFGPFPPCPPDLGDVLEADGVRLLENAVGVHAESSKRRRRALQSATTYVQASALYLQDFSLELLPPYPTVLQDVGRAAIEQHGNCTAPPCDLGTSVLNDALTLLQPLAYGVRLLLCQKLVAPALSRLPPPLPRL